MFRNIKTVKHIKPKVSWWVASMDIQNISNQPTQEIHTATTKIRLYIHVVNK